MVVLKIPLTVLLLISMSLWLSAQRYDDEPQRSPVAEKQGCILFGDDFETGCWDVSNPGASHATMCPGRGVLWKHAQL